LNDSCSSKQIPQEHNILSAQQDSVCKTPAEKARLLKLFQIFIEIDQNLKKKNNANS